LWYNRSLMDTLRLKSAVRKAPKTPGVYFWRDGAGRPLYIGKAGNLRSRLSSYPKAADTRIRAMLHEARTLDWEEYGGVPLMGVNGVCFIGHGASGAKAFHSAIRALATFVERRVNEHIREEILSDDVTAA